jgi:hypothetical protein
MDDHPTSSKDYHCDRVGISSQEFFPYATLLSGLAREVWKSSCKRFRVPAATWQRRKDLSPGSGTTWGLRPGGTPEYRRAISPKDIVLQSRYRVSLET